MTKKKSKTIIFSILGILAFVLVISTLFYFGTRQQIYAYDNQCDLDSCSSLGSGWTEVDASCSGNECERECRKESGGHCGNYGSTQSKFSTYRVDVGDEGDEFYAPVIIENADSCYKYMTQVSLEVSDFNPSGGHIFASQSYKLFAPYPGKEDIICSGDQDSYLELFSSWYIKGRGQDYEEGFATGKYKVASLVVPSPNWPQPLSPQDHTPPLLSQAKE